MFYIIFFNKWYKILKKIGFSHLIIKKTGVTGFFYDQTIGYFLNISVDFIKIST